MSLALSLCASEAWPRPGLAEPGSASIAGFGNGTSFINITEKEKLLWSRQAGTRGLVFGFVFGTWNWYVFWRRSWGLSCCAASQALMHLNFSEVVWGFASDCCFQYVLKFSIDWWSFLRFWFWRLLPFYFSFWGWLGTRAAIILF